VFFLFCPKSARVVIGTYVSGVAEIDFCLLALSQGLDFWIFFLSQCRTRASSHSSARCNGFWQVMPSCAKRRPSELALNFMPNLSLMSLATSSRVHNARHYSAEGLLCVCRRLQCVI
jgi:hypothetical protein